MLLNFNTSFISETEQDYCIDCAMVLSDDNYYAVTNYGLYTKLNFSCFNNQTLTQQSVFAEAEHGMDPMSLDSIQNDFLKISASWNYKLQYNEKGKTISIRVFAGKFIYNNTLSARYNWRMDGQHGFHDYTYNTVFPTRFESDKVFSHQFIENHGAIKTQTALGQSIDWMASVNLKADLPIPVLKFFADFVE